MQMIDVIFIHEYSQILRYIKIITIICTAVNTKMDWILIKLIDAYIFPFS